MKIPHEQKNCDLTIFYDCLKKNIFHFDLILTCLKRAEQLLESLDNNTTGWDDEKACELKKIIEELENSNIEKTKDFFLNEDDKDKFIMFLNKLDEGIKKDNAEQTLGWYIQIVFFLLLLFPLKNKDFYLNKLKNLLSELMQICECFLVDIDIEKLQ